MYALHRIEYMVHAWESPNLLRDMERKLPILPCEYGHRIPRFTVDRGWGP